MSIYGGHRNDAPAVVKLGVGFSDVRTQEDWLADIDSRKPIVVTCVLPSRLHSPWRKDEAISDLYRNTHEIDGNLEVFLSYARKVLRLQCQSGRVGVIQDAWSSSTRWREEIYPLHAERECEYQPVRLDQRDDEPFNYGGTCMEPLGLLVLRESCLPRWVRHLGDVRRPLDPIPAPESIQHRRVVSWFDVLICVLVSEGTHELA